MSKEASGAECINHSDGKTLEVATKELRHWYAKVRKLEEDAEASKQAKAKYNVDSLQTRGVTTGWTLSQCPAYTKGVQLGKCPVYNIYVVTALLQTIKKTNKLLEKNQRLLEKAEKRQDDAKKRLKEEELRKKATTARADEQNLRYAKTNELYKETIQKQIYTELNAEAASENLQSANTALEKAEKEAQEVRMRRQAEEKKLEETKKLKRKAEMKLRKLKDEYAVGTRTEKHEKDMLKRKSHARKTLEKAKNRSMQRDNRRRPAVIKLV
ncbi:unnamed protein product [Orchesella dallaii]|uniref:Uncharacterized protein n=1 Tax=Orchesella dallaii TaxID=48710 RepID=A0ABP1RFX1_9HEXA